MRKQLTYGFTKDIEKASANQIAAIWVDLYVYADGEISIETIEFDFEGGGNNYTDVTAVYPKELKEKLKSVCQDLIFDRDDYQEMMVERNRDSKLNKDVDAYNGK